MTPIASPSRTGDPGHRALPGRVRVRERAQDPARGERRDPASGIHHGTRAAEERRRPPRRRPGDRDVCRYPRDREAERHSTERRSSWAAGCGRVAELHGRERPGASPRGGGDAGHGAHRARTGGRRRRGRTSRRRCRTRPPWWRSRRRGGARSSRSAARPRRSPSSIRTTEDRGSGAAGAGGRSSGRRSSGAS